MDRHTPTTGQVRSRFALYYAQDEAELSPAWSHVTEWAEAAFDRWLAEHDREVAAKALRDAADDGWPHVAIRAESAIFEALHLRADRIERGENP